MLLAVIISSDRSDVAIITDVYFVDIGARNEVYGNY
jgi:hypothetical protein